MSLASRCERRRLSDTRWSRLLPWSARPYGPGDTRWAARPPGRESRRCRRCRSTWPCPLAALPGPAAARTAPSWRGACPTCARPWEAGPPRRPPHSRSASRCRRRPHDGAPGRRQALKLTPVLQAVAEVAGLPFHHRGPVLLLLVAAHQTCPHWQVPLLDGHEAPPLELVLHTSLWSARKSTRCPPYFGRVSARRGHQAPGDWRF